MASFFSLLPVSVHFPSSAGRLLLFSTPLRPLRFCRHLLTGFRTPFTLASSTFSFSLPYLAFSTFLARLARPQAFIWRQQDCSSHSPRLKSFLRLLVSDHRAHSNSSTTLSYTCSELLPRSFTSRSSRPFLTTLDATHEDPYSHIDSHNILTHHHSRNYSLQFSIRHTTQYHTVNHF